jgi:ABC-type dipeptide/oligopeptide/nickel transport system permease component
MGGMQVHEYVARRLIKVPFVLIGLSILIFGISRLGGSPIGIYLEHEMTPQERVELEQRYGLDKSLPEQYARWLAGIFRGDLGWSGVSAAPVTEVLPAKLAASAELAFVAGLVAITLGISLGTYAGARRNRWPDHATRVLSISGASLPLFWFALISLIVFYLWLGWAPMGRADIGLWASIRHPTGFYTIDALLNGNLTAFADALRHLWLPALVLGYQSTAQIARIMRSSLVDEMSQDYVDAARAKGLPERRVIRRHARRNALVPTVTVIGTTLGLLMVGSVVVELVFQWPGLGRWIADGALRGDRATVMAFILVSGVVYMMANLVVDVVYAYLDRRVELGT